MKRFLRYLAYTLLFAFVMIATLVIVASTQTFQRKVLQHYASKYLDHFEVKEIHIYPSGLDLTSVVLAKADAVARFPLIHIKWDRSSLLYRNPLHIKTVDIEGFLIDIPSIATLQAAISGHKGDANAPLAKTYKSQYDFTTHTKTQYATPIIPATPFAKHFRLDKLEISGKINLEDQAITLKALGKDIGSYRQGLISLDVQYSTTSDQKPITDATLQTELNIMVNEEGLIQKAILDSAFIGHSRLLNTPAQIKLQALIEPSKAGEHYALNLYTLDGKGQESPLFDVDATLNVPQNTLHAKYKGYAQDEQILPFLSNINIPNFNLQYEGVANYDFGKQELHLMEVGSIEANDFGQVDPSLKDFKDIQLFAKVDLKYSKGLLDLRVLEATLKDNVDNPLLKVELGQPFKLHVKDHRIKLTQAQGDLLRIHSDGFPIAYLSPFFPDYQIQSNPLSLDIILSFDPGEGLRIRANRPIELSGLNLRDKNTPLLEDMSLRLTPEAIYQDQYLTFYYKPLEVTSHGQTILNAQGVIHLTMDGLIPEGLDTQGKIAANITAWVQQKIIQKYYNGKPLNQTVQLDCTYNLTHSDEALSVKELQIKLTDDVPTTHKEGFLNLTLKQPIVLSLDDALESLYNLDAQGDILSINLQNFPVSLVTPVIPKGIDFRADKLTGHATITRLAKNIGSGKTEEGLSFKMDEPINLTHVYLAKEGQSYLSGVHLSFFAQGFISQNYLEAKWQDLLLAQTSLTRLPIVSSSGTVRVLDNQVEFIELESDIDLPQLLAQPNVGAKSNLETGLLRLYAQASPRESSAVKANLQLKNIGLISPAKQIDTVTLAFQGTLSEDNSKLEFVSPLTIDGPSGTSDLNIRGLVNTSKDTRRFNIEVEGTRIELNDVLLLTHLAEPQTSATSKPQEPTKTQAAAPTARNTARDSKPFWHGLQGNLEVNVQAIAYAQFTLDQLMAKASITDTSISVEKLTASILEAPFDFSGSIIFDQKEANPYTLSSKANLQNLDMGPFLVLSEFAKEPPVDGTFSIATNAYSSAPNLDILIEDIQGDFQLQGRNGKLYTYSGASDTVKVGTQVVRAAGAIFGGQVKELDFLSQVVDFFKEIPYYQINIQAKRGANLNIDINRFLLEGPEVYLTGMGRVTYQENVPIGNQPLEMTTRIDAKGKAASLINSLGLLRNDINKQGYYIGPEFHITGTASSPSFKDFYNLFSRPRVSPGKNGGPDQESIFGKLGLPIAAPKDSGTKAPQKQEEDPIKGIMNLFGL